MVWQIVSNVDDAVMTIDVSSSHDRFGAQSIACGPKSLHALEVFYIVVYTPTRVR